MSLVQDIPLFVYLKVHKALIDYILTNKEDQRIVKAMIKIEHKRIYELLKNYGCDMVQGYFLIKPLPIFEFQKLLR